MSRGRKIEESRSYQLVNQQSPRQSSMDTLSQLVAISGIMGLVLLYGVWRVMILGGKSKRRSAPEPFGAWPFLGHLPILRGQTPIFRTLGAMADKHGPVFMIRLGVHRTLVVSSCEAVKECFTTNDKVFASRPSSSAGKILGYNHAGFGFAPYGALWREMRKLSMMEILSARRLNALKHVQISELDLSIKDLYSLGKGSDWVHPVKVVMSEWFQHLSFNIVLKMIAGKRYFNTSGHGNEEPRRAIATIQEFLSLAGAFVLSDAIPGVEWMDLQGYLGSMKRVAKEVDSLVGGWVEEHEMRLNREGNKRQDFIDVMLSVLEDTSMFGHSRETVIKATKMVCSSPIHVLPFSFLESVFCNQL